MVELPVNLAALAEYKQFVIWRLEPPKKKVTVNPNTLNHHDAHDPAIWLDYQTAISTAILLGEQYHVGFTITESDPFWFLDIDDCKDDQGNWSQLATSFCQMFNGCAVEISQSGNGHHRS